MDMLFGGEERSHEGVLKELHQMADRWVEEAEKAGISVFIGLAKDCDEGVSGGLTANILTQEHAINVFGHITEGVIKMGNSIKNNHKEEGGKEMDSELVQEAEKFLDFALTDEMKEKLNNKNK